MKIENVSCKHFAGLRLVDPISFTDGINVVYGKNESGKSTLVNLISNLLFQSVEHTHKEKKDFEQAFFPVGRVGSTTVADSADGRITLATDEGRVTLEKVWGAKHSSELDTDDGSIRDQKGIDEALKKVLTYGKGVYSELLLSSQKNTNQALQNILDVSKTTDAQREITDKVTQAFAETGGLSVDEIEQRIDAKIKELSSNWDIERNMPKKKTTGGRHQRNNGEVLELYYAWEDAKKILRDLNEYNSNADAAAGILQTRIAEEKAAQEKYNKFEKNIGKLTRKQEIEKNANRTDDDLKKWNKIANEWPELSEKLKKAQQLKDEQSDRQTVDLYTKATDHKKEAEQQHKALEGKICPEKQEIDLVKTAQSEIRKLESSLSKMNIQALVKMAGGHTLEVISLLTGKPVDYTKPIKEAVRMTVPGVMEMELAPAKVDTAEVQNKIKENNETVESIFTKYAVKDLDELEALANSLKQAAEKLKSVEENLDNLLGTSTYEDLEKEFRKIEANMPRTADKIETDIQKICGKMSVSDYVSENRTTIKHFTEEHETIEKLNEKIQVAKEEKEKLEKELDELKAVTEEYGQIKKPQEYLDQLKDEWDSKKNALDAAKDQKRDAENRLSIFQEGLTDDPADAAEHTRREFEEKKERLAQWQHIRQKLQEQKELIQEHPLEDLTKKFTEYLGIISGGHVTSDQPDADKLDLSILSGNRPISFDLLSEGTKDTVSLAFRLAIVDHLFPHGGGVIVLDDPLTDMDEDRVQQACELIKDAAKRHQVIFLTCREEYQDLLQGNMVRI